MYIHTLHTVYVCIFRNALLHFRMTLLLNGYFLFKIMKSSKRCHNQFILGVIIYTADESLYIKLDISTNFFGVNSPHTKIFKKSCLI